MRVKRQLICELIRSNFSFVSFQDKFLQWILAQKPINYDLDFIIEEQFESFSIACWIEVKNISIFFDASFDSLSTYKGNFILNSFACRLASINSFNVSRLQ